MGCAVVVPPLRLSFGVAIVWKGVSSKVCLGRRASVAVMVYEMVLTEEKGNKPVSVVFVLAFSTEPNAKSVNVLQDSPFYELEQAPLFVKQDPTKKALCLFNV